MGLALNMKSGNSVVIGEMEVTIAKVRGQWVTLRIEAPREIKIGKIKRNLTTGKEPITKEKSC